MTVDREMRQVCAELELLSHGKVTAYNSSGRGESYAVVPQGEANPPHIEFAARYEQEQDDDRRRRVLEEARRYLQDWKKRATPVEDDGTGEADWIIEDGKGSTPDDVASRFKTTPTRVRKLRKDRGLDTETGFGASPVKDNSRERVLNLAGQGCTLRQIEFQTGVSKSKVQRWLKEAA